MLDRIIMLILAVSGVVTNLRMNRIARNLCQAIISGDYAVYRRATGKAEAPYKELKIDEERRTNADE